MALLVVQFLQPPVILTLLGQNNYPHHPVLKHPQSVFSERKRPSFTSITVKAVPLHAMEALGGRGV
jgi:hypothetical protein